MIDNITRFRKVQLDVLTEFIRVCEEHNLKYYAFFGTLLGAVRFEGYLPWDDDVDVAMPEEDYRTMCRHKEWFDDAFFLQTPLDEGFHNFARLRKNGTTDFTSDLIKVLRRGGHLGISIDIIPLVNIPGSGCLNTPTLGSAKCEAVYLKDWFEPAGTVMFEGIELRAPAKLRKILTEVYDAWDWPNGAGDIHPKHWFFDTDNGYEKYVKRYTGMLEGIEGKNVYLFGAADSLRVWLERFGLKDRVVCTFDNDSGKWGKTAFGVDIKNPAEIPELLSQDNNSRIIIVSLWHQEIGRQLEKMGVDDYYVFLDNYYDDKVGNEVTRREDMPENSKLIPKWNG